MDSEALRFKESCEQENKILAAITEKEVVSDEMAFESLIIVKNLKVDGVGDALIYASALSALNTYVKQSEENKKAVGYSFKKNVDVLTKYIIKNPNELIRAEIQKDKDMSLCLIEIGGIQFSFHNVEMSSTNKALAVRPGEETMKWDGIRKQRCAVTLFDFAMNSTYDRGNKMMDGSGFSEGLESILAEYRAGTRTIDDAKKVVFGENRTGASSVKVTTEETIVYPYRNKPVAPLYQGNAGTVFEELNKRTFVDYLIKIYEQDYGFKLPEITGIEWKYAMESLARAMSRNEINAECGVRVDCCRLTGQEFLTVVYASKGQDEKINITTIQMLSWEEMKYESDGSVTYCDYDSSVMLKSAHPSNLAKLYAEIAFKYLANDERYVIKPCVFMYDASFKNSTDIINACPAELLEEAPVFYANDHEELARYVSAAIGGSGGRYVLSEINKIRDIAGWDPERLVTSEQVYITDKITSETNKGRKGILILNNRKSKGNETYLDYLIGQLNDKKINYCLSRNDEEADACEASAAGYDAIVYYDFVPDKINYDSISGHIIIVDEYALYSEDRGRLTDFIEQAVDNGMAYIHFAPAQALGYHDYGAGNNWLIRNLTLGNADYQRWIPALYPINLVDDTSEFSESEEIAHVTIPATVTFDVNKGSIKAEHDIKTDIYRALTGGKTGVELYIEDAQLMEYISKALEDGKNRAAWMDTLIEDAGGDIEQYIDSARKTLDNTNSYNIYQLLAKQSIGISAWNKMQHDSQDWLVSALLSYSDMKNTDPLMDFSGVTLMVSKVFENELTLRLGSQYEGYMYKKYGDRLLDELPVALVDVNQFGEKKVMPVNKLTLGSIPFIMGMDAKGRIKDKSEYEKFKVFCEDELLADKTDIDKTLREICDIVYYVRVNFRNKSAHKDVIDLMIATDCVEYCVTVKRKLGYLLDMFSESSQDSAKEADFIKACMDENKILAAIDVKENVTEETALKAEIVINNMLISGVGDVLLYGAALNVLNTYVKINEDNHEKIGYSFKRKVDEMIHYLADNPSTMVKGEVQQERGMSLFMLEVNTIQFSYHQIELNNDSRKFLAKDMDNPQLKWDGIRKQMCSVSAFEFAMSNKYDRGFRMLDGTDFNEGMNALLEKYHAGQFTIEDSKKMVYGITAQPCPPKLSDIEESSKPIGFLPSGILLTTDAATFIRKAEDGLLTDELIKACTQNLGYEVRDSAKTEWLDAIKAFTSSIQNAKINRDAGIRVMYIKYFDHDLLMIEVASMKGNYKGNIAIVWLMPWKKMHLIGNDTVIVDVEAGQIKCAHPSKSLQTIVQIATRGVFNNHKYFIKPCVLLYGAEKGEDTDIVSYYNEGDLKRCPVFYRGDKDITEYIRQACADDRGPELIEDMDQQLSVYRAPVDGGLTNESSAIIDAIAGKLWDKHKSVVMINLHKAKGCTQFEDELVRRLEDAGEPYAVYGIEGVKEKDEPAARTVIYSGIIPEAADFSDATRYILIFDKNRFSKNRRDALDAFLDASRKNGARIDSYRPAMHLGYKDYGCGVCWIMRILDIGYEKSRLWSPDLYPIDVLGNNDEFNSEKNIAHVTIDRPYTIDMFTNEVHGSSNQKLEIYEQLITGTDGAQLKILDTALRTHVANYLEVDTDYYEETK